MGRSLGIGWPRVGAWTGTLKNPTKCLWRWEPDRRYNFFSPPAHMCRHIYNWNIVAWDVKLRYTHSLKEFVIVFVAFFKIQFKWSNSTFSCICGIHAWAWLKVFVLQIITFVFFGGFLICHLYKGVFSLLIESVPKMSHLWGKMLFCRPGP